MLKWCAKRGEDGLFGKSYMGGQWWQLMLLTGEFVSSHDF